MGTEIFKIEEKMTEKMKPQVFSQPVALKTRSRKYQKEKVKKTKNVKNVIIYHM